jgi:hypothetical protein
LVAITLPLVPFGIETLATETGRGTQPTPQLIVLRLWFRNPKKIAKDTPTTSALTTAVRSATLLISSLYTAWHGDPSQPGARGRRAGPVFRNDP